MDMLRFNRSTTRRLAIGLIRASDAWRKPSCWFFGSITQTKFETTYPRFVGTMFVARDDGELISMTWC